MVWSLERTIRGSNLDPSALRRPATVVWQRGDIDDAGHFETRCLKRSNGGFATGARSANLDIHPAKPMLLRQAARLIGGDLRSERGALSRSLKVNVPGAGPGNRVSGRIGDGDERIVERRTDVYDANRNILPLLLLAFLDCLSCHMVLLLRLLLAGNGLRLTLASSSVVASVLAVDGETAPMAETSVATDFHETTNIAVDFPSKISFDLELTVQNFAKVPDFGFGQIAHFLARVDVRLFYEIVDVVLANAVKQRKRVKDRFIAREVDTCNSRHVLLWFLLQP